MELLSKPVSLSCVLSCMWADVSYKMIFYLAVEDTSYSVLFFNMLIFYCMQ